MYDQTVVDGVLESGPCLSASAQAHAAASTAAQIAEAAHVMHVQVVWPTCLQKGDTC